MNNQNNPRFYKKKELASLFFPSFNPTIGWRMINTLCQDQPGLHDLFHSKRQYVTPSEYKLIASKLGVGVKLRKLKNWHKNVTT